MTLFAILQKPEFDMDLAGKDETKERLKEKQAKLGKRNSCCDNLTQSPVTLALNIVSKPHLTPRGSIFGILTCHISDTYLIGSMFVVCRLGRPIRISSRLARPTDQPFTDSCQHRALKGQWHDPV